MVFSQGSTLNHVDGSKSKVLSSYMVLPVSSENFPRVALAKLEFKQKITC